MTTFHPFPRLSVELRLRIWEMTVEPREVEVRIRWTEGSGYHHPTVQPFGNSPSPWQFYCLTPVPSILQACREARNHGLYQKEFSEMVPQDGSGRRYVWLNWDVDMVSIGNTYLEMFAELASRFKRLKFKRGHLDDYFWDSEWKMLPLFCNVKEIHIDCATGFPAWVREKYGMFSFCGKENVLLIDAASGETRRIEDEDEYDSYDEEDYED